MNTTSTTSKPESNYSEAEVVENQSQSEALQKYDITIEAVDKEEAEEKVFIMNVLFDSASHEELYAMALEVDENPEILTFIRKAIKKAESPAMKTIINGVASFKGAFERAVGMKIPFKGKGKGVV